MFINTLDLYIYIYIYILKGVRLIYSIVIIMQNTLINLIGQHILTC